MSLVSFGMVLVWSLSLGVGCPDPKKTMGKEEGVEPSFHSVRVNLKFSKAFWLQLSKLG